MPTVRLAAKKVPTLSPIGDVQTDYFDSGANVPGFGIRVSPSGRRTWFLMYRANGRQKRHTIGTNPPMSLAKARKSARTTLLDVQVTDADPAAAKRARRSADTFEQLAEKYIEDYAKPHKKSWREDGRQIRTMCLPRWKSHVASDITRADVRDLLGDVAKNRGGVTANRLRALLSKLFRWAVSQDYIPANPASELPKLARERSRPRVLSDDELRTLWARLDETEANETLAAGVVLWLRLRALTAFNSLMTAGESGTMCWFPAFISVAGISHTRRSKSMSAHFIRATDPPRWAFQVLTWKPRCVIVSQLISRSAPLGVPGL